MKDVLLATLPLLSAYVAHVLTARSMKDMSITKFKEEKYGNLIHLLQGFVGKTRSGTLKIEFFNEQYRSWLYSEDQVVKAINNMVEVVKSEKVIDQNRGQELIGNIVLAM